jgi:hypothetical protein
LQHRNDRASRTLKLPRSHLRNPKPHMVPITDAPQTDHLRLLRPDPHSTVHFHNCRSGLTYTSVTLSRQQKAVLSVVTGRPTTKHYTALANFAYSLPRNNIPGFPNRLLLPIHAAENHTNISVSHDRGIPIQQLLDHNQTAAPFPQTLLKCTHSTCEHSKPRK